jgi:hypothetical protein
MVASRHLGHHFLEGAQEGSGSMCSGGGRARCAALVNGMADALGVNLGQSLSEGRIASEDLREAAIRCSGCPETDACCRWLAAHSGNPVAAPDYCCIADLLAELKQFDAPAQTAAQPDRKQFDGARL